MILLHTMLRVAHDTPIFTQIAGAVPKLLSIEIHSCRLPRPDCRPSDIALGICSFLRKWDVYFVITVNGNRQRITVPNVSVRRLWRTGVNSKVLLRLLPGETSFTVQAYTHRHFVNRVTLGNSSMGPTFKINLEEAPIVRKSFFQKVATFWCMPNGLQFQRQCEIELSAQVLE